MDISVKGIIPSSRELVNNDICVTYLHHIKKKEWLNFRVKIKYIQTNL